MGDMSGSKDSSSSSSSSTTNNNIDRRQVVAEGAIGVSADGSTINVQSMDAGIVQKALDTVASADAISGQGFNQLLTLADKVITGAGGIIAATQATTDKQMDIISTTANDAKGQIDQKTIMVVVGVAGAVAVAYAMNKGK